MEKQPTVGSWIVGREKDRWESHRRTAGWLNVVVGLLGVVGIALVLVTGSADPIPTVTVLVALGVPLLHVIGGTGLLRSRRWLRATLWPVSVIDLLAFPIGTALGAYNLWVLYNTRAPAAGDPYESGTAAALRWFNLTVFALTTAPVCVSGQYLAAGVWSGTLSIGGANLSVQLTVSDEATPSAMMQAADGPQTPVMELRVDGRSVVFTWGAFRCHLLEDGPGYRGTCSTADGTDGQLELAPQSVDEGNERGRRSDSVTGEELRATGAPDLFDALMRLRPRWIKPVRRGGPLANPATVQVFLGRHSLGGPEALRSFVLDDIAELRYYVPRDAIVRYGSLNQGGVIEIILDR
jgi:hypothetical protein